MEPHRQARHNDLQTVIDEFQDYAYSVSHDLGAPVRGMVEFSRLLEESAGSRL